MRNTAGGKRNSRALARLDTSLVECPRQLSSRALRGNGDRSSDRKPEPDQLRSEQTEARDLVRIQARTRSSGALAGVAGPKSLGRGTQKGIDHA